MNEDNYFLTENENAIINELYRLQGIINNYKLALQNPELDGETKTYLFEGQKRISNEQNEIANLLIDGATGSRLQVLLMKIPQFTELEDPDLTAIKHYNPNTDIDYGTNLGEHDLTKPAISMEQSHMNYNKGGKKSKKSKKSKRKSRRNRRKTKRHNKKSRK